LAGFYTVCRALKPPSAAFVTPLILPGLPVLSFLHLLGETMAYKLNINGVARTVDVEDDTPLLWVLRDTLGLTGTKYGCGTGVCGACTVHIDGQVVRSCVMPVSAVGKGKVRTIEALSPDRSHALQQAWIAEQVPQCGYCQSGMLMAAAALLKSHPKPTDAQIEEAMTNLCRCGTYPRVRRAIRRAAGMKVEEVA
jgi:isoquinoline 1-oxidoreductase alpha subunit